MARIATEVIRGHTCNGLKRFQSRIDRNWDNDKNDYVLKSEPDYGCIPVFDEEGFTRGCDATNYMAIEWCPFCGTFIGDKLIIKTNE